MKNKYYTYILASKKYGTLYTGVTNDIIRRMHEHKTKTFEGFTRKYDINLLVWFDSSDSIEGAITAEKKIKNCRRKWKIDLIEKNNPNWRDLSLEFMDTVTPLRSAQHDKPEHDEGY
jgi:putative endonuclease